MKKAPAYARAQPTQTVSLETRIVLCRRRLYWVMPNKAIGLFFQYFLLKSLSIVRAFACGTVSVNGVRFEAVAKWRLSTV